jgi:hypothetical protein
LHVAGRFDRIDRKFAVSCVLAARTPKHRQCLVWAAVGTNLNSFNNIFKVLANNLNDKQVREQRDYA